MQNTDLIESVIGSVSVEMSICSGFYSLQEVSNILKVFKGHTSALWIAPETFSPKPGIALHVFDIGPTNLHCVCCDISHVQLNGAYFQIGVHCMGQRSAHWVAASDCGARGQRFDSTLCLLRVKPACVALGRRYMVSEYHQKQGLINHFWILWAYKKLEKDHCKPESTWWDTIILALFYIILQPKIVPLCYHWNQRELSHAQFFALSQFIVD